MQDWNSWRSGVRDALDLPQGGKRLISASQKAEADENTLHVILGLGGTGTRALLEVKTIIERSCKNARERVVCLAVDTDRDALEAARSSEATGAVALNAAERAVLSDLRPHDLQPEVFSWLDERLIPRMEAPDGLRGARQIGRLALLQNHRDLLEKLCGAIKTLDWADFHMNESACLYFHVISGVSGVTGGSALIEMPHLLRYFCESVDYAGRVRMFGHVFTPDVHRDSGAPMDVLNANAYAALQELDYNLSLRELEESYELHYAHDRRSANGKGYFDDVFLISGTNNAGNVAADPIAHGARIIARHILDYAVREDAGNSARSVYSNLAALTDRWVDSLVSPHRYHGYRSMGFAELDLPMDDIMSCAGALLFERMSGMLDAKPTKAYIDDAILELGLDRSALFRALKRALPGVQEMLVDATFEQLQADRGYWLNRGRESFVRVQSIVRENSEIVDALTQKCIGRFEAYMREAFGDCDRGPVFASRILQFEESGGLVKRLKGMRGALRNGWLDFEPNNSPVTGQIFREYAARMGALDHSLRLALNRGERARRTQEINACGKKAYELCVELALAEALDQVYARLEDYIKNGRENFFHASAAIFEELCAAFRRGGDALIDARDGAEWTLPALREYVRKRFDATFDAQSEAVFERFGGALWNSVEEWMNDPERCDPCGFAGEFLDDCFADLANLSLEDALRERFGGALRDRVEREILPRLDEQSRPMYEHLRFGLCAADNPTFCIIGVPGNCPRLRAAVEAYCKRKDSKIRYVLMESDRPSHFYMQKLTCALSLANLRTLPEMEGCYARLRDQSVGLHLVHTADSPHARERKSWNDLYTLIPRCRRGGNEVTEQVQRLLDEEDARKELFRRLIESGSPMMKLHRDERQWRLEVHLTESALEIRGDALVCLSPAGDALKTWRVPENPAEKSILRAELEGLRDQRLAALPAGAPKTRGVTCKVIDNIAYTRDMGRTMDALLEACQRRLELVYAVRAETAKYGALEEFLRML